MAHLLRLGSPGTTGLKVGPLHAYSIECTHTMWSPASAGDVTTWYAQWLVGTSRRQLWWPEQCNLGIIKRITQACLCELQGQEFESRRWPQVLSGLEISVRDYSNYSEMFYFSMTWSFKRIAVVVAQVLSSVFNYGAKGPSFELKLGARLFSYLLSSLIL